MAVSWNWRRRSVLAGLSGVLVAGAVRGLPAVAQGEAMGPLRVHPGNPRYFADPSGRARLLAGSHTWRSLIDLSFRGKPEPPFDFDAYLDLLQANGHNFIRLWTWETARWDRGAGFAAPLAWSRTGRGTALDGAPRFDLHSFDAEYFQRLHDRTEAARARGIYVSVMLFEGYALQHSRGWEGHPFNRANNANGIDGDLGGDGTGVVIYTLRNPVVTALQEAYVRQVVATVGDLDNVLYEISNENTGASSRWQVHMMHFVRDLEAAGPLQHPVGMTFQFKGGSNRTLFNSPADWISPNPEGGYMDDPPLADGRKVMLVDTDHLWGIGGDTAWVWKTVTRGGNPLLMDPMDRKAAARWDPIRRSMGEAIAYADRMDLAHARPSRRIASSRYCLAVPGAQYLVFVPGGGAVTVDLSTTNDSFASEWLDTDTGAVTAGPPATGGDARTFDYPGHGDAVLFLWKEA